MSTKHTSIFESSKSHCFLHLSSLVDVILPSDQVPSVLGSHYAEKNH